MFSFSTQAKTRITLEKRTLIDDGFGGESASWAILDTVWAVLDVQQGGSAMLDGKIPESTQSFTAWIRHRSDMHESQPEAYRVRFDGRTGAVQALTGFDETRKTFGKTYQRLNLTLDAPSRG